jgi:hypothetical protein
MKLGSHRDYRGSRAYAPDLPSASSESWVTRTAGPLTAWVKHVFEMLLKPGARQAAETMWLVHGEERHFSVLGAEYDRKPRRVAALCPFPEAEVRTRRPIRDRPYGE